MHSDSRVVVFYHLIQQHVLSFVVQLFKEGPNMVLSLGLLALSFVQCRRCVHFHLSNLLLRCTFARFSTLVGVVPNLPAVETANRTTLSLSIDFHGLSLTSIGLSYSLATTLLRRRSKSRSLISWGHLSRWSRLRLIMGLSSHILSRLV